MERTVLRDHPRHLCHIVRRRDADEIEREDDTFVRQPNHWGAKRTCEHRIAGDPPEWPDMLAGQSVADLAGYLFRACAAQKGQEPRLRIEPLALRPQHIFEL